MVKGHSDIVLCVDVYRKDPSLFVSSSKVRNITHFHLFMFFAFTVIAQDTTFHLEKFCE